MYTSRTKINNYMQKIKFEIVHHFWMAVVQSSFSNKNNITPKLNSALWSQSHWQVRREPPERSSPMIEIGVLAILILFGIGAILMYPKNKPEPKKVILIEAEGPIETVEIKKVEDILIR